MPTPEGEVAVIHAKDYSGLPSGTGSETATNLSVPTAQPKTIWLVPDQLFHSSYVVAAAAARRSGVGGGGSGSGSDIVFPSVYLGFVHKPFCRDIVIEV